MRILFVSDLFPPNVRGGYERRCAATASRLTDRHDVFVLTRGDVPGPNNATAGVMGLDARNIFRSAVRRPDGISGLGEAQLQLRAAVDAARTAVAIAQPDIVYVWNGANMAHATLRTLENSGIPIAYCVAEHWYGNLFASDYFMRQALRAPRRDRREMLADVVLGPLSRARARRERPDLSQGTRTRVSVCWNSEFMQRSSTTPPWHDIQLERVVLPASGSETVFATVNRRPPTEPHFLFVGRLDHAKGVDLAILALARLRKSSPKATLSVVGDGDPDHLRDLQAIAEREGVVDAVKFRGSASHEEVAALMADASAVVVPSRWNEPFGIVALESAWSGAPVIAARVGGLVEVLGGSDESLFFERDDHEQLARLMGLIVDNPEFALNLSTAARARAESLSFDRYMQAQEAFLSDSLQVLGGTD